MEAEELRKQTPPPHPSVPANYVSLAQLQEQRRLKLERQWREEEEESGRLRKQEQERERLRKLQEEVEEMEREEARRRQAQSGTFSHAARRGRGRGPARRGRRRGEAGASPTAGAGEVVLPEGGGAVAGGEEEGGGGGRGGERGRNGRLHRSSRRRRYAVVSKSPNPEVMPAAAGVIGGEGSQLGRDATQRNAEVKPSPGNVEEGERKEPPLMGGVALERKLEERPRDADPALSSERVEGGKEARKSVQTARRGRRQAKPSETVESDRVVEVAQKLKDLSIAKPGGDVVGIVGIDNVEHWPQRATVVWRGRHLNIRADGILGPRPVSSMKSMMWVKKIDGT